MDNIKIGLFLQSLRKEKGITQNELAEHFGISNKTVSKWECGDTLPEIPLLKGIAEYYGVTVDEILNGERNSISNEEKNSSEEKDVNVKKIHKFNLGILISLSFNFLMFIIGISVGFGATNGLAAGLIGLIGAAVAIILYLVLAYVFDRDYFNDIEHNKRSILYVIAINLFVLIISARITSICSKNTMVTFQYLINIVLKLFSFYGFAVLLFDHIMCSEKKKEKTFVYTTLFLSVMLTLGIFLNYVHIYQLIYDKYIVGLDYRKHYLTKYAFYDNLGESEFTLFYVPLLLTIATIIVSYFVVSKKISDLPMYILGLITFIVVIFSQFYMWYDEPAPAYADVEYARMYEVSKFTYVFFILYLLLAYIKYFRINKKIQIIRFMDISIVIIFVVSTIAIPFVFEPLYDERFDIEIDLQEMYTHYFLGKLLLPIHIVLLLGTIALFILFVVKNINIIFTFVIHLANVILFNISLFVFEQKYNDLIAEDMVYVPDFFIIMSIVFYLIIILVLKIKRRNLKEEKENNFQNTENHLTCKL